MTCLNCEMDDLARALDHAKVDLYHDRKEAEREAEEARANFKLITTPPGEVEDTE